MLEKGGCGRGGKCWRRGDVVVVVRGVEDHLCVTAAAGCGSHSKETMLFDGLRCPAAASRDT